MQCLLLNTPDSLRVEIASILDEYEITVTGVFPEAILTAPLLIATDPDPATAYIIGLRDALAKPTITIGSSILRPHTIARASIQQGLRAAVDAAAGGEQRVDRSRERQHVWKCSNDVTIPRRISRVLNLHLRSRVRRKRRNPQGPADLDIAASRSGSKLYLHVANRNYSRSVEASFAVPGMTIGGGKVHEIAPEDPLEIVFEGSPDVFAPKEKTIAAASVVRWSFPARSVCAVELDLKT